ncbi:MAG: SH3 domain-containing protein [Nitrospinaceae bacterium]|nr:SH3 domain-containing protein [Nitrospinaceae bacterium]NIR56648.1 SH3 domain-containing protein [Nitrospinaceae bacterium]NIS87111.1 SH3 domain-containing protein [Nitrospinaceae bacterium]NIT83965.1 SH3 domain-containing protein [Nitrospinaceae bacterium]NIU46156.1 SH3 domain-containing protein [Nitrospinaceae bacterium]
MKFEDEPLKQMTLAGKICMSCRQPLQQGAIFCENCGPPVLPADEPENGMPLRKAIKQIAFLTLMFAIIVAVKTNWDYAEFFARMKQSVAGEKTQEIPQDKDYQLVHYVNVSFANIRAEPSGKSKIITSVGKNEKLVVVGVKGEHWTQVDLNGTKGYIATRLLSPVIE